MGPPLQNLFSHTGLESIFRRDHPPHGVERFTVFRHVRADVRAVFAFREMVPEEVSNQGSSLRSCRNRITVLDAHRLCVAASLDPIGRLGIAVPHVATPGSNPRVPASVDLIVEEPLYRCDPGWHSSCPCARSGPYTACSTGMEGRRRWSLGLTLVGEGP